MTPPPFYARPPFRIISLSAGLVLGVGGAWFVGWAQDLPTSNRIIGAVLAFGFAIDFIHAGVRARQPLLSRIGPLP